MDNGIVSGLNSFFFAAKARSQASSRKNKPLLGLISEISPNPKYIVVYQQVGLWPVKFRYGHKKLTKENSDFFYQRPLLKLCDIAEKNAFPISFSASFKLSFDVSLIYCIRFLPEALLQPNTISQRAARVNSGWWKNLNALKNTSNRKTVKKLTGIIIFGPLE